jgi:hypothetical protein
VILPLTPHVCGGNPPQFWLNGGQKMRLIGRRAIFPSPEQGGEIVVWRLGTHLRDRVQRISFALAHQPR